jgi:hypothetical protein
MRRLLESGIEVARGNRRYAVVGVVAAALGILGVVFLVNREGGLGEVRAPEIDTVDAAARLAPLPPSLLSVPVDLDLAPMIAALESAVPEEWGDLEERLAVASNDRLEVAFALSRAPFQASFEDSLARVATTISYRARAWYDPPVLPTVSASCGTGDGEAPPRLDVALTAPLTLDREWRLRSRVAVDALVPGGGTDRDRCRVTVIRWDMTERVVDEARRFLEDHASGLDSLVADVDLRSRFEEWWSVIAKPIELAEDVWLVFAPEGLMRGPIRGYGEGVRTILGLRARPRLVVGPRPVLDVPELPPLDTGFVAPGFAVRVEARAEYDEASALLDRELVGRTLTRGDRTVRLEGFEVSGIGRGRLAVAVDLGGDARGRLYLVGTPRYDPDDGRIGVPDLDFDVASGRALVEGAAWLARVGLVGLLRDAARWPAGPAVSWAREQVEGGLNRSLSETVRLEGRVASVDVVDVVAGLDALRVRADVRAEATLHVGR